MGRPITAEDLWSLQRVGQPEHVPGTTKVVVPVVSYREEGKAHSTIYSIDRTGTSVRLTSDDRSSTSPAPSPDGTRIAFLGSIDDEPAQVYVMSLAGGEAFKVSDLPLGASSVTWMPGGDALIVSAPLLRGYPSVEATVDEQEARKDTTRPIATEDRVFRHWKKWLVDGRIDHLFRIDLDDESAHHLTPGLDRLIGLEDVGESFTVTPDGQWAIFTLDDNPEPWEHMRFSLHRVPTAGGDIERIPTGESVQQYRPRVSPDGSTLVYGVQYEHAYYADLVRIVSHHLPTGAEEVLTAAWDRSAGGWEFIDDDALVFHAEDEGRVRIFTLAMDGGTPIPQTSTGSNHGPRVGLDCYWHRHESMAAPAEVAVTCGGTTTIVSTFNDAALAGVALRPAKEVTFEGADGAQIQAFVVEPPDFHEATMWPLLHNVHGGPHNGVMDNWHWRWNPQVMAAAGYVVISVNFHGSSSFGDAFTRSIRGSWGDRPAIDIEAATDHMLSLGTIDPDRMAIAGGSYGGYLVTWITTLTDRYAAAICHAGVTDLLGQYASDHTEGRDIAMGGTPWEDMDAVNRWSPMAHTHDVVTPTLVIHGEMDYRVVITQGLTLYGLLKAKGVPTRLVYYGDEGHWIERRDNALHWWGEFLGWLDRFV
ncbi:MAG TPA: S9 family peptidase [Acidimicrobiia bacterium]|nr:S9 family peptidase [Acidimicrobiia bacterium]